jgi:hypothetical protein
VQNGRAVRPLLVTKTFPAASETFIHDQVRLLLERGLGPRVLPILPNADPDAFPGEAAERATDCSLSCPTEPLPGPRGYPDPPPWAAPLMRAGVKSQLDVPALLDALAAHATLPGTVIHAHFLSPAGVLVALLRDRLPAPVPAILELHGYDIFRVGRAHPEATAEALRRFDAVVVSSGQMELVVRTILEETPPEAWPRLVRISHGIDLGKLGVPECHPSLRSG